MSQESRLRGRAYTPGFSDALGDRFLVHGSGDEPVLEALEFRPELSESIVFETALRARIDVVQAVKHHSIAAAHGVERPDGLGLCLVSEYIEGRRLSELGPTNLGTAFVMDVMRTVTPVLCVLNQAGVGVAHGALSAERIVVSPDGRLVVVEHALGWAIESLRFSRKQLNELGIVVGAAEPPRFDSRTDVMQLGFLALSLLLRRRLDPADCPEKVPALLEESADADGSPIVPSDMRGWLERALQIGPRPFASAHEAVDALDELDVDDDPAVLVDEANALLEFPDENPDSPGLPAAAPQREVATVKAVETPGPPARVVAPRATPAAPAAPAAPATPVATKPVAPKIVAAPIRVTTPVLTPAAVTTPAPQAAGSSGRSLKHVAGWILGAVSLIAMGYAIATVFVWFDQRPTSVSVPPPDAVALDAQLPPNEPVAPTLQPRPTRLTSRPASRVPGKPSANRSAATGARRGAAAEPKAAPARLGSVTMTSPIALQVFLDGTFVGTTERSITLPEGTHRLEVVNETLEFRQTQTVRVESGRTAAVRVALPNGKISLNATPWADVTIDGAAVGQTPIANYSLTIGTHEVVFRHPQLGTRRQTIVVKAGATLRVTEVFQQ